MERKQIQRPYSVVSPRWSNTTKLVVGLSFVAIFAGLLIGFKSFVVPIMIAFLIAYIIFPVAKRLYIWTGRFSWRLTVTVIYIVFLALVIGSLTWGGIVFVDQIQSLYLFIQETLVEFPSFISNALEQQYKIGSFELKFDQLDVSLIMGQLTKVVQPAFSGAGTLLGVFASSAASIFGWLAFVFIVSYFIVVETRGEPDKFIQIKIPGYENDLEKFKKKLGFIWNSFFRGQLLLMLGTIVIYTIVLGIMGVRFYYGLAVLAGLARLVPYLGPTVAWTTYGLVAFFQTGNPYDVSPIIYVLIVVGIAWILDTIFDNVVTPRVLGDALKVHPAGILVTALISISFFGLIGVIIAAPILATVQLFGRYAFRKMNDLDPWLSVNEETEEETDEIRRKRSIKEIMQAIFSLGKKIIINIKQYINRK